MLTAKMYGLMWILVAAVGALYLTDSLNFATATVLGFSASAMAGAFLLVVYPALLTERISSPRKAFSVAARKAAAGETQRAV